MLVPFKKIKINDVIYSTGLLPSEKLNDHQKFHQLIESLVLRELHLDLTLFGTVGRLSHLKYLIFTVVRNITHL